MALLDLSKFALLALLISAMEPMLISSLYPLTSYSVWDVIVSTLGGAEMVIREVVRKGSDDEACKANGEVCGPTFGKCCEGYICIGGHWPPSPWSGSCIPEGDLPDTFKTNRAEAEDEAQMVIKEEVMMVEKVKFCLPRGAHCHMAAGPRCCGRFECLPRIPGTKPLSGICQLPRS